MRSVFSLLLLAIACNGSESSQLTFPAGELREFILRIPAGSITVRPRAEGEKPNVCLVKVTESGGEKALGAAQRLRVSSTKRRLRIGHHRNEPGLRLDIEVVVPPGVNLDLVLRDGPIRIEGAYGRVAATTTTGDVVARLERCRSATVKSAEGDVTLEIANPKLAADTTCETVNGNASLVIAPGYRGPIQLYSGSGEIDLGDTPAVPMIIDPEKKNARGFAGTPMTPEEVEEARKAKTWPAGLWAKTQKGRASFRVR